MTTNSASLTWLLVVTSSNVNVPVEIVKLDLEAKRTFASSPLLLEQMADRRSGLGSRGYAVFFNVNYDGGDTILLDLLPPAERVFAADHGVT